MEKSNNRSLDTLGRKGTRKADIEYGTNRVLISGNGTSKENFKKTPMKKFLTQKISLALVDVAKAEGSTEWEKCYWNTWHCRSTIISANDKAYGNYCKNRWCILCAANRKADLINKYYPEIITWSDAHFLTLTVKAQRFSNLKKWMHGMVGSFKIIKDRCRKRNERSNGPKLVGVRSLECNYNPKKKTYNPHFHVLCKDRETATTLKNEWCDLWTSKYALPYLQKIRKVGNTEKDMIETFKYGAKIFTDPTVQKGKDKSVKPIIYAAAMHEIYKAFKGINLCAKFGFKAPLQPETKDSTRFVDQAKIWLYDANIRDWIDEETGQVLANYIPDENLENLLLNNINVQSI